jgi:hypothetical protein
MCHLLVDFDDFAVVILESAKAFVTRVGEILPGMPCRVVVRLALPFDLLYSQ